ncbi:ubiquinol-cytochrome C reductase, partial [Oerskovia sp. NPDC060287]
MSDNQNSTDLTKQDGQELDRFQDPGIPAHKSRMADRDPKAAKRAEMQVVILFTISIIGTIGMLVAFFALPDDTSVAGIRTTNLIIGLGLAFALLGIGLAAVHWAKTLMSDHEHVDERHAQRSSDAVRAEAVQGHSRMRPSLVRSRYAGAIPMTPDELMEEACRLAKG